MYNMLVVEDDKMLNQGISLNFQVDGFRVDSAFSLKEAREVIRKQNIDILLLDVNLPDGNGFEFCKEVRKNHSFVVIFLTACDMESDVINGFRLGGDDYITKPFSINILKERVSSILRRYENKTTNIIKTGSFIFDFDNMLIKKNEKTIALAVTEYKILKKLVMCRGKVVTRAELLDDIWENDNFIDEHALTVNINRIRNKIEKVPAKPKYLKTVYGMGYMWIGDDNAE